MTKVTVIKIPICVDILDPTGLVAADNKAERFKLTEEVGEKLKTHIDEILKTFGFVTDRRFRGESHIVPQRDGCSLYDYYLLYSKDRVIKVVIDLRVANHKAKPSYEASKQSAKYKVATNIPIVDISKTDVEYLDVVFKGYEWGLQYFVGGANDYMKPVDNIPQLDNILYGKIGKIVEKYQ